MQKPLAAVFLFAVLLPGRLQATSPTVTIQAESVSSLETSTTISMTVQLIDPGNTGMVYAPINSTSSVIKASRTLLFASFAMRWKFGMLVVFCPSPNHTRWSSSLIPDAIP